MKEEQQTQLLRLLSERDPRGHQRTSVDRILVAAYPNQFGLHLLCLEHPV